MSGAVSHCRHKQRSARISLLQYFANGIGYLHILIMFAVCLAHKSRHLGVLRVRVLPQLGRHRHVWSRHLYKTRSDLLSYGARRTDLSRRYHSQHRTREMRWHACRSSRYTSSLLARSRGAGWRGSERFGAGDAASANAPATIAPLFDYARRVSTRARLDSVVTRMTRGKKGEENEI